MQKHYRHIAQSSTLAMNTLAKTLEYQGKTIYKFGFGQSPFEPPQPVIKALKNNAYQTSYSHVQGDAELRRLIAKFHADANGITCYPEHILVAPGSKILIYIIMLAIKDAE